MLCLHSLPTAPRKIMLLIQHKTVTSRVTDITWWKLACVSYPSKLICNGLLVAVAVQPGEDCPLVGSAGAVQDEARCKQHVVRELIALHLQPQIGQLKTQPPQSCPCTQAQCCYRNRHGWRIIHSTTHILCLSSKYSCRSAACSRTSQCLAPPAPSWSTQAKSAPSLPLQTSLG